LRIFASCLLSFIFLLLTSLAGADDSLTHNVGSVEMLVSDWGALTRIDNEEIHPNFGYSGKDYLDPFSEIWVGDSIGHVASAYDGLDADIVLGEWQPTAPSGHIEYLQDHPNSSQSIHAQYAPSRYNDFPFDIIVDQYTYAWDSSTHPDDDDYIIMKLVLTNSGTTTLQNFFLAVQTNWDVDYNDERDDLIDWDAERQSGTAYDSDGTDPTHVALTLIDGKFASHNIVDAYMWSYLDSDRSDLMSNGEIDDLRTIGSVSGNYLHVTSTGPYNIPAGESVSVIYAFVVGESSGDLQKNIDSAKMRVAVPGNLAADPSKEAIYLKWSPGIRPDAAAYKVYRSSTSGSGYLEIAQIAAGDTAYNDTGIEIGNTYYYVVTSVGQDGSESTYSNEVRSSPGIAPPPPRDLTIRSDPSANPVLHWDEPTDGEITGYKVFRNSTGDDPWAVIAEMDTSVRSFVDQNVYAGNSYYYTVASINTYSWTSEYSNVVSISIELSEVSETAVDLSAVTVVPNPLDLSSGERIKFVNLTDRAKISVYTLAGELVRIMHHTDGSGKEEWDLRNEAGAILASGTYLYYVESYKTQETGKFTKSGKFALIR